ncbi:hypothetical protein [Marmoricola sp. RAF53]|uniref:hypothetical protein n=1 Tax=Marmoricola sp. RAF53 TaxID=3233059 RepID=UPI003F9AE1F5
MGNVTLPTPVFLAGGAFCLLAGYLVGVVAGPGSPEPTTAKVASFQRSTSELCLEGDAVKDEKAADSDGLLCGTWSHSAGATVPREGDEFRFVLQETSGSAAADGSDGGADSRDEVVIYGTVVR